MSSIEPGRFRIGLRVDDVAGASRFYAGLGFEEVGSVPNDQGPVRVMLARDGIPLMADALVGMPFPIPTANVRRRRGGADWVSRSVWVSMIST